MAVGLWDCQRVLGGWRFRASVGQGPRFRVSRVWGFRGWGLGCRHLGVSGIGGVEVGGLDMRGS